MVTKKDLGVIEDTGAAGLPFTDNPLVAYIIDETEEKDNDLSKLLVLEVALEHLAKVNPGEELEYIDDESQLPKDTRLVRTDRGAIGYYPSEIGQHSPEQTQIDIDEERTLDPTEEGREVEVVAPHAAQKSKERSEFEDYEKRRSEAWHASSTGYARSLLGRRQAEGIIRRGRKDRTTEEVRIPSITGNHFTAEQTEKWIDDITEFDGYEDERPNDEQYNAILDVIKNAFDGIGKGSMFPLGRRYIGSHLLKLLHNVSIQGEHSPHTKRKRRALKPNTNIRGDVAAQGTQLAYLYKAVMAAGDGESFDADKTYTVTRGDDERNYHGGNTRNNITGVIKGAFEGNTYGKRKKLGKKDEYQHALDDLVQGIIKGGISAEAAKDVLEWAKDNGLVRAQSDILAASDIHTGAWVMGEEWEPVMREILLGDDDWTSQDHHALASSANGMTVPHITKFASGLDLRTFKRLFAGWMRDMPTSKMPEQGTEIDFSFGLRKIEDVGNGIAKLSYHKGWNKGISEYESSTDEDESFIYFDYTNALKHFQAATAIHEFGHSIDFGTKLYRYNADNYVSNGGDVHTRWEADKDRRNFVRSQGGLNKLDKTSNAFDFSTGKKYSHMGAVSSDNWRLRLKRVLAECYRQNKKGSDDASLSGYSKKNQMEFMAEVTAGYYTDTFHLYERFPAAFYAMEILNTYSPEELDAADEANTNEPGSVNHANSLIPPISVFPGMERVARLQSQQDAEDGIFIPYQKLSSGKKVETWEDYMLLNLEREKKAKDS